MYSVCYLGTAEWFMDKTHWHFACSKSWSHLLDLFHWWFRTLISNTMGSLLLTGVILNPTETWIDNLSLIQGRDVWPTHALTSAGIWLIRFWHYGINEYLYSTLSNGCFYYSRLNFSYYLFKIKWKLRCISAFIHLHATNWAPMAWAHI